MKGLCQKTVLVSDIEIHLLGDEDAAPRGL
jgi:hypothetical protein